MRPTCDSGPFSGRVVTPEHTLLCRPLRAARPVPENLFLPFRGGIRLSACGLVTVSLLTVMPVRSAVAGPQASAAFVDDTNNARARHDRREYAVRAHLTDVAQRWAEWMAEHQTLRHNPYLQSQVHNWSELGENIGCGPGEQAIQRAFMASAPHRDNILSVSFREVGIGSARGSDGKLYVDEVFRRRQ